MTTITKRQQEIFDFIMKFLETNGFPPAVSEIQKEFSFKSPNAVQDHLSAIERKGYISRNPFKSRGIKILINNKKENENNNAVGIPIVGTVSAGIPILAEENIEGNLTVDKSLFKQSEDVFALHVKGNSMIDANIKDGDYVIIQKQSQVEQGEIAIVLIDNETTVKRVYKEKDKIRLQPENESMLPIIIDPKEKEISIIGKLNGVIRKI